MKYAFISGTNHAVVAVWYYETKEEALKRQKVWDDYMLNLFPERVKTGFSDETRIEYQIDDKMPDILIWSDVKQMVV